MVETGRENSRNPAELTHCRPRAEDRDTPGLLPCGKKKAQSRYSGTELVLASQMEERGILQIPVVSTGTVRGSEYVCKLIRARAYATRTRLDHPSYSPELSKDGESYDMHLCLPRGHKERSRKVGKDGDFYRCHPR